MRGMDRGKTEFDNLVIGGGYGGLTAALLLALRGEEVCLIEGHTTTGGSAGYFDRFERGEGRSFLRYRFDVGATTLSGLHEGGPLRRIFEMCGSRPALRRVDPGMIVTLRDGTRIDRWSDLQQWIAECRRVFSPAGQADFWNRVYRINQRGWRLSQANQTFPPKNLRDLLSLARPINLKNLDLLPALSRSVEEEMRRCGVDHDPRFREFIGEQLMITAQNIPSDTPFLVGAMGLAYPADTWYPEGGMYGVIEWMEEQLRERGGEIRTKRKARALRREGKDWIVETTREVYRARRIISNLTTWDTAELLGKEGESIHRMNPDPEMGLELWGAFTLYVAVSDVFDDRGSLYHQVHSSPLSHIGSRSIFISLSPPDDPGRAPEGWRMITASTHVPDPGEWERLATEHPVEYERRKDETGRSLMELVARALPGFQDAPKKFLLYGTPRSFAFYTGRRHGRVGGVPHSLGRNLFRMPTYRTRLPDVYLVGDTVYPGQGVPAVVLGALNLVEGQFKRQT